MEKFLRNKKMLVGTVVVVLFIVAGAFFLTRQQQKKQVVAEKEKQVTEVTAKIDALFDQDRCLKDLTTPEDIAAAQTETDALPASDKKNVLLEKLTLAEKMADCREKIQTVTSLQDLADLEKNQKKWQAAEDSLTEMKRLSENYYQKWQPTFETEKNNYQNLLQLNTEVGALFKDGAAIQTTSVETLNQLKEKLQSLPENDAKKSLLQQIATAETSVTDYQNQQKEKERRKTSLSESDLLAYGKKLYPDYFDNPNIQVTHTAIVNNIALLTLAHTYDNGGQRLMMALVDGEIVVDLIENLTGALICKERKHLNLTDENVTTESVYLLLSPLVYQSYAIDNKTTGLGNEDRQKDGYHVIDQTFIAGLQQVLRERPLVNERLNSNNDLSRIYVASTDGAIFTFYLYNDQYQVSFTGTCNLNTGDYEIRGMNPNR